MSKVLICIIINLNQHLNLEFCHIIRLYYCLWTNQDNNLKYEFIELKNNGIVNLDLSFISLTEGIAYTFPTNVILGSGDYYVLASDSNYFNERYGFFPDAQFDGQLDNGGEKVILSNAGDDTLIFIRYDDQIPWPVSADGGGYSLIWTNDINNDDENDPLNWSASQHIHGSPGLENPIDTIPVDTNLPNDFELYQNFPNTFNPVTTIRYGLRRPENVKLIIFNLLDQKVKILVDESQDAGRYDIPFNASNLAIGVYIYRIQAGKFLKTRKMIVLK